MATLRELAVFQLRQRHAPELAASKSLSDKIGYSLSISVYLTSATLVSVVSFAELYRMSNFRTFYELFGYALFLVLAGFTGVFILSIGFNLAMIILSYGAFYFSASLRGIYRTRRIRQKRLILEFDDRIIFTRGLGLQFCLRNL